MVMGKLERKISEKKLLKEKDLFEAAFDLFISKGFQNTAIDDIVKKAGVAKGTFYLYFKDKYDIINRLILQKSSIIIKEANAELNKQGLHDFNEKTIFFINYVIDYFKDNKLMLKLINKNFSVGIYRRAILRPDEFSEVEEVVSLFIDNLLKNNMDRKEAQITLFIIFELVGSICYSSIIMGEPDDIETIKPILYKKILVLIKN
jgi:AcrR family transcriptional regulator